MEEELYAEALLAESGTKQTLYTCSEEEYLALTTGKAKVKIVPAETIKVLDAELVDEESRAAAKAAALEKAKEEVKSAAAKFQMDPEEAKVVSQDLDSLAPEAREAKLAADAEALERAKEDVKLASAQFQMETDEADRIMSEKRAKTQSAGKLSKSTYYSYNIPMI